LSFLLLRQKDAVGLALYDRQLQLYRPPSARMSQFHELVRLLEETEPGETTNSAAALTQLAERLRRRSLVVVFSDFLDEPEETLGALRRIRAQRHEVIAMQILEPVEQTLGFPRAAEFRDLETNERVPVHPYFLQSEYRRAVEQYRRFLQTGCAEHGIDFVTLDTTTPFDRALMRYLARRRRM
jgi:uncharacterized protein (DUF58 family)